MISWIRFQYCTDITVARKCISWQIKPTQNDWHSVTTMSHGFILVWLPHRSSSGRCIGKSSGRRRRNQKWWHSVQSWLCRRSRVFVRICGTYTTWIARLAAPFGMSLASSKYKLLLQDWTLVVQNMTLHEEEPTTGDPYSYFGSCLTQASSMKVQVNALFGRLEWCTLN